MSNVKDGLPENDKAGFANCPLAGKNLALNSLILTGLALFRSRKNGAGISNCKLLPLITDKSLRTYKMLS